MDNRITDRQILDRFQESGIPFGVCELQNGATIIISERGGHIFGPFPKPGAESILWTNQILGDADAFASALEAGEWNLGGERIWIAPEIQFHIRDRTRFWETLEMPAHVDPGSYSLEQTRPGVWRLNGDVTLQAHNLATGRKDLQLERWIARAEDPLRNLSAYPGLLEGVLYMGYEHTVRLSEVKRDDIMSQAWNLIQVNPGGSIVIPASPRVETTDYLAPIDEDLEIRHAGYVELRITGDRRYKVGYKAAHATGRLAYLHRLDDERAQLIVRAFFPNPSSPYVEEPADRPGRRGDAIHVYNDDGMFGGFGELECHGQTIGGETGRSSSTDQMLLWVYVGPEHKLIEIATHLLDVEL